MSLSKKQINGLIESARKWEAICNNTGFDDGSDNCELCSLYVDKGCKSCPIAIYVGKTDCINTPYDEWEDHHQHVHGNLWPRRIKCSLCEDIAKCEWEFILSLIP